jgi:protein TIF31
LEKVYASLGVASSELIDDSGEQKTIHGPYDAKGLLGTDQRKYILEVMRLYPRDANYEGPENSFALIRPELIEQQFNKNQREFVRAEMAKRIEEKKQESATEETKKEDTAAPATAEEGTD